VDTNLRRVLQAVLEAYALPWNGLHGIGHWARVLENGRRLADATGANLDVVQLFAVLHDSRRFNEGDDPDHGPRASEFASTLRGRVFQLADSEFGLLWVACADHTHELSHPDPTIQTCWDADRLDLARVGVEPDPAYLSAATASMPDLLEWAIGRGAARVIPTLVNQEWGIDVGPRRRPRS
jgi:uncharacterized protein